MRFNNPVLNATVSKSVIYIWRLEGFPTS